MHRILVSLAENRSQTPSLIYIIGTVDANTYLHTPTNGELELTRSVGAYVRVCVGMGTASGTRMVMFLYTLVVVARCGRGCWSTWLLRPLAVGNSYSMSNITAMYRRGKKNKPNHKILMHAGMYVRCSCFKKKG